MVIVLTGKSSSGKDVIKKKLVSLHNYINIVRYTTRPKRKGEVDNIDYHFISEKNFKQKIDESFFAEWKSYNTEFGTWYYGTALEDLQKAEDNSVIILPPDSFREVKDKLNDKVISIYIYSNNPTIKKRLIARGDNPDEAKRRLEHDNKDFKGVENEVDKIVYNNDGTDIEDVVKKIMEVLNE